MVDASAAVSAYDAAYVALAEALDCPLLTADAPSQGLCCYSVGGGLESCGGVASGACRARVGNAGGGGPVTGWWGSTPLIPTLSAVSFVSH